MLRDRTSFILVCIFAIFWQWKQPLLPISYYNQLAWQQRHPDTVSKASIEQPLVGVTVVITGPTSGLGLGLAKTLYRMGATIVAVGRSPSKLSSLNTVLASLDNESHRVYTFVADFTDLVSVSKAADAILAKFDSLDFLINNAGGNNRTSYSTRL